MPLIYPSRSRKPEPYAGTLSHFSAQLYVAVRSLVIKKIRDGHIETINHSPSEMFNLLKGAVNEEIAKDTGKTKLMLSSLRFPLKRDIPEIAKYHIDDNKLFFNIGENIMRCNSFSGLRFCLVTVDGEEKLLAINYNYSRIAYVYECNNLDDVLEALDSLRLVNLIDPNCGLKLNISGFEPSPEDIADCIDDFKDIILNMPNNLPLDEAFAQLISLAVKEGGYVARYAIPTDSISIGDLLILSRETQANLTRQVYFSIGGNATKIESVKDLKEIFGAMQ